MKKKIGLFLTLLLVLVLTACFQQPPPIVITATPEPTPVIVPTETPDLPDWYGWEDFPNREDWPSEIDDARVGYVYVSVEKTHLVYMNKNRVYTIYENPEWGNNAQARRVTAKYGRWVMVYVGGDSYKTPNDQVRPFTGDGGALAYLVMNEQRIDGRNLWEFDHPVLYVKYEDTNPEMIYVP